MVEELKDAAKFFRWQVHVSKRHFKHLWHVGRPGAGYPELTEFFIEVFYNS